MGHPDTIKRKIRRTYDKDSVECEKCGEIKPGKNINVDVSKNGKITRDRKTMCNSCFEDYLDWYEKRSDHNGWVTV